MATGAVVLNLSSPNLKSKLPPAAIFTIWQLSVPKFKVTILQHGYHLASLRLSI